MDVQTATLLGQALTVIGVIATAYFGYKTRTGQKDIVRTFDSHAEKDDRIQGEIHSALVEVKDRVSDVHDATNGMKAELERQKYEAGLRQGAVDERARAAEQHGEDPRGGTGLTADE
jgi:hypothetical protein